MRDTNIDWQVADRIVREIQIILWGSCLYGAIGQLCKLDKSVFDTSIIRTEVAQCSIE